MLNAQSAKVYFFQNLQSIQANCKIVNSNFFEKLQIDGNLVVKSKVPSRSGSIALKHLNPIHKKGHKVFLKQTHTHT